MRDRKGQCMCGAVRFSARDVPSEYGACHCEMCRRWTGSALLGVTLPDGKVTWDGEEHITRVQSSSWAERAFCNRCGSGLWFRVTIDGPYAGNVELPIGLFDDAGGMTMNNEIYIDHKPDSYAYAGEGRTVLTRQQCVEKFAVLDGD
ncbi:MAG: GFA family protein [Marinibacterium sp.]